MMDDLKDLFKEDPPLFVVGFSITFFCVAAMICHYGFGAA